MSSFPTTLYDTIVDDISAATLKEKLTNDSTYSHATVHRADSAEIIATQTKIGTGASTPVASSVLCGTGAGTSAWDTTPTVTTLTTTGACAVDSLAVTGAVTAASFNSTTLTLDSDLAWDKDAHGNFRILIGGTAGTLQEIWVPTTGSIQDAITDVGASGVVRIMKGTHTPSAEITVTNDNVHIYGMGIKNTIISAASFSVANQSIFKVTDADTFELENLTLLLDTNSDKGLEIIASAGIVDHPCIHDIKVDGFSAATQTGIVFSSAANTFTYANLDNVFISADTVGIGFTAAYLIRSQANMIINTDTTSWTLDANSVYNQMHIIDDKAGTDSGANNTIVESTY